MKRILVVGDSIIDRHWYCTPISISPEAPILTWSVDRIEDHPGGVANVVNNLHSLCMINNSIMPGKKINISFISGITAQLFCSLPENYPVSKTVFSTRKPTIKNRIIFSSPHQQITRFDQDNNDLISKEEEFEIIKRIRFDCF